MKLDILAIGVHPDDVELGCSGTLIKHIAQGKTVGIVDLTQGELGSRGSAKLRLEEAEAAKAVIGAVVRENLGMADGFFENNKSNQMAIAKMIRKFQPDVVLANSVTDRHPDHGRAAKLVSDACFYSGLNKVVTELDGLQQEIWRPKAVYHYIQDRYMKPDFVVDVSDHVEQKMEAIKAFSSQFYNPESTEEAETPISSKQFMDFLYARMADFGRDIGADYAEGFTVERTIGVEDLTLLG